MMYRFYRAVTYCAASIFSVVLKKRTKKNKEHPSRINEKKGIATLPRPSEKLIWIHAASVGEAQSALILINKISEHQKDIKILITTGTLTSANLMEKRLPKNAFHQFYPLDHPKWTKRFLKHWRPDLVLWMESELWPNMLYEVKKQNIPAFLINARMSERSFKRWKYFKSLISTTLNAFHHILCQTENDKMYYDALCNVEITVTDNIKYSSSPLEYNEDDLHEIKQTIQTRPVWLYASTHDGEEEIACEIHNNLKEHIQDILTIIVPRHPERRDQIKETCQNVNSTFRGSSKNLPDKNTDIYIADTMGELGLFYVLSPIACIGRSLSNDGGGGHNPIEAAQHNCAVLYGPNVQNLQEIFDEMNHQQAAHQVKNKQQLQTEIKRILETPDQCEVMQKKAKHYASQKISVIDNVMDILKPTLEDL